MVFLDKCGWLKALEHSDISRNSIREGVANLAEDTAPNRVVTSEDRRRMRVQGKPV